MWARASMPGFWVLLPILPRPLLFCSSTHTPLIFTVTHHCSCRPIAASPPFNCLHLRHSVCVAMAIPQCSTHTVSPSLRTWSQLAADDAGRLQTSSLPLGRRPIFTTGHKVYGAAQHIYGTASNHSTARKTISSELVHPHLRSPHRNTAPFRAYLNLEMWRLLYSVSLIIHPRKGCHTITVCS